ncbi:SCP2 sterol-binding domain-containing protein [Nocardia sp. NPDC057668]|uniref:SCP2 sterol-binding domain-containing protein n=1 Tax=Nocardia sp. NPDC057668 TaxID=3346202 RepID=UPI00366DE562
MAIFGSTEELYGTATPFLERVMETGLKDKLVPIGSFRIVYSDPAGYFLLDPTMDDALQVTVGDTAAAGDVDVQLTMSADDGHRLLLGTLNIKKSLALRKVKVSGPLIKLLSLLPAFEPIYAEYRKYLTDIGRPELLDY